MQGRSVVRWIAGALSRASVRIGLITAAVLGVVLWQQPPPASSLQPLARPAAKLSATTPPPAPLVLDEVSLDLGIAVAHEQSSDPLSTLSETLGAGVCAIDFNRDGFMDLFFVGGRGHTRDYGRLSWWRESLGNRLLENKAGHRFEDVTARAKLDVPMWGMGCTVADLDNDGSSDLLVTGVKENRLFRNRGNSVFEDVTARSGITGDDWSTGASVADYDGDGLLDVYVTNYVSFEKGARTFERSSGFRTAADIAFDQTLYDPEPNRLYRNRGGFRFEDVAVELGVTDTLGRGLGARFTDVDGDLWPDLLVINDHETPNQLYLNDRGKGFVRASGPYAAFELAGAHDVAFADFDGDGRREAFMSRGRGNPAALLAFSDVEARYVDTTWQRGATDVRLLPLSGWAAVPADLNNDGHLDLFVANGSTLPDADTRFVAQAQPSSLFVNDGRGSFRLQPVSAGSRRPHSARGAISVDVDNDGRLELVVVNNNDALEVLRAQPSSGHWLVLDLGGAQRDVERYGAIVTARGDGLSLTRVVDPAQHFLSQGDPRIHLGLGKATRVAQLEIAWRDGSRSTFRDVAADRVLAVDRKANTLTAITFAPPAPARLGGLADPHDPATLLCLARILTAAPAEQQDMDRVGALWRAGGAEVRLALLERLPETPGPRQLALLEAALHDPSVSVRLSAVERLRRAELERSVAWLIPLLDDADDAVRCAAAGAFRFFFDEEEAVTHRKALAVAPLIRLLSASVTAPALRGGASSGSAKAQVCAADALASAESKRAVLPLIALARAEVAATVKAAAVRALGLIRDTRAVEPLRALVKDPASDPAAVGAALIALSRLDDATVDLALSEAVTAGPASTAASVVRSYEVLSYLLATPEGVVFSQPMLARQLESLVAAKPPRALGKGAPTVALTALRAIAASRSPKLEAALASFLSSGDQQVRVEALVALSALESPAVTRRFEARLLTEPLPIVDEVLDRVSKGPYAMTPAFVSQLFERPGAAPLALRALRGLPRGAASAALGRLLRSKLTTDELLPLLDLCIDSELQLPASIVAYETHPSLHVRARYAVCLLQRRSVSHGDPAGAAEPLRARAMLTSMISDPATPAAERLSIVMSAAKHDPVVARTWLTKEIRTLPAEQLPAAIAALAATGTAPAVNDFLLDLFADAQRPRALRLQAAELLASTQRERVVKQLYAESGERP